MLQAKKIIENSGSDRLTHPTPRDQQARVDDPYESDARYPGCFFGVATFPIGYHHLTYGIVMNVLNGLWWYLYRAGRYQLAVFEVRDDQFGTVGIGKITPERPDGVGLGSVA